MITARLRRGDGIGQRAWLRSVVRSAQRGLIEAGQPMSADGRFGSGTGKTVRAFQNANGLEPSGVVGPTTWGELTPHIERAQTGLAESHVSVLRTFRGDLYWVHLKEGHNGRPYWPGGVSGVTLDPGVDLGHASAGLVEGIYGSMLTKAQLKLLRKTFGLKGQDAKDVLAHMPELRQITISREQALGAMPFTAQPYWDGIRDRFPALSLKATPPSVQTVLLSLAYNRGIRNSGLELLGPLLQNDDWHSTARAIGRMQQNHKLDGIRRRRREEAAIVLAELELLAE